MRRRSIWLLSLYLACGSCAAPEPAPVPEPAPLPEPAPTPVPPPEPAPMPEWQPPVTSPGPDIPDTAAGSAGPAPVRRPPRSAAAPAEGLVSCAAVDDDVPASDCRAFTLQKARLRDGLLVFDPPPTMTMGQTYDLTASIGKIAAAEEVRNDVRRAGRMLEERALKVGKFMTAELIGPAFTIVLQGMEGPERELGSDRREIWQWKVTPVQTGRQRLLLKVSADAIAPDGQRHRFDLKNKPVDVLVEISKTQRRDDRAKAIEDSLGRGARVMSALEKWLIGLAALLAAAGGAWLAIRKFGKSRDAAGGDPGKP